MTRDGDPESFGDNQKSGVISLLPFRLYFVLCIFVTSHSFEARNDRTMPPKRRTRGATPAQEIDENAMVIDTPEPASTTATKAELGNDPWTDEQETSLFKGVIKWKPAGQPLTLCQIKPH